MYSTRLWPHVAPVIRGFVGGRAELLQTVKNYGAPPVTQSNPPLNFTALYSTQQNRQQNGCCNHFGVPSTNFLNKELGIKSFILPFTTTATNTNHVAHNENDHAHRVLRSLPAYTATTIDQACIEDVLPPIDTTNSPPPLPNINWNLVPAYGVAGSFIALSRECKRKPMDLCSKDHVSIIKALTSNIPYLSNEQLKDVLAALTLWPHVPNSNSPNFSEIWNALDGECVRRVHKWDLEHSYFIADLWYTLRLSRIGSYTKAMLSRVGLRIKDLKAHELVQFLFHINLSREPPANVSVNILERRLINVIDTLSIEELGVVAMGLFKTQSFIQNDELSDAFFDRLINSELSGVSSISLASILKILRRSAQAKRVDKVYQLLQAMLCIIPSLSLQAQLHLALLGTNTLVFNAEVMNEIVQNFAEETHNLRLKDIERVVFTLMLYNYIPDNCTDILQIFAEELRRPERREEINKYPKSYISCVNYMVTMAYLPSDLISTALHPIMLKSMENIQNYSDIGREVMELDCMLDIEAPAGYRGNRLEQRKKQELVATYARRCRLPRDAVNNPRPGSSVATHQEKLTVGIEDKLMALLDGPEKLTTSFILPYTSMPDMVFCTTLSGEPAPLPEAYLQQPSVSNKLPVGMPDLRYTAVVVGGRNSYVRGTTRVRGQLQMKIRHLQKLGYTVALIPFLEYSKGNLRHKLTVLNDTLVKCGALVTSPERVETAHFSIKAKDSLLQPVDTEERPTRNVKSLYSSDA